jgi:glutathione S-transferase
VCARHTTAAPLPSNGGGQPFLLDAQPVYADFALYGVRANLTYNDWSSFPPLPRLAEWFGRMKTFRFT